MWQNYGYDIIFHGWTSYHKNESLKSAKIRNTSTNNDYGTVYSLPKFKLLETVNKLLHNDVQNKQKLIDGILEHNSNLQRRI